MLKLLVILFIVMLASFLVVSYVSKKVRAFFAPFIGGEQSKVTKVNDEKGEVVYKKDDVIVMKGDAGKNQE